MPIDVRPCNIMPPNKQSFQPGTSHPSPFPPLLGLHQLHSSNIVPLGSGRLLNMQTSMSLPSPSTNKRPNQMETSGKLQAVKGGLTKSSNKRPAQVELLTSKAKSETFESVRSKLRESLATALAIASEQPGEQQSAEKKCNNDEDTASDVGSKEKINEDANLSGDKVQGVQSILVSSYNEVPSDSMTVADELLQGHGLQWVSDLDAGPTEAVLEHGSKRLKTTAQEDSNDVKEIARKSESLAFRIEAELFRLFGGVNKKYKEKGRSLLFNLKDRNNPELRERVLSGDIAPERLCAMSAEELASKELSQWRLAKAEEMAQMVVLPIQRLMSGDDQSDAVSVEVELGAGLLSRIPSKGKEEVRKKSKSNELKEPEGKLQVKKADSAGNPNLSSNLETLLEEKSDLMQELMVDDFKDSDNLPPIVSYDEFMEPLILNHHLKNLFSGYFTRQPNSDSERVPESGYPTSDPVTVSDGVAAKLDSTKDGSPLKVDSKDSKVDVKNAETDNGAKSTSDNLQPDTSSSAALTSEILWEGAMQLTVSLLANVIGLFRSGEKLQTKEWPSFLEIKGRVRFDAFEKFLQQLPLSRSRAIMISQFCWKEGSPESGRVNLSEVTVESYIADERVGFAEPTPGVELYLCPPHSRTLGVLATFLSKEHAETLRSAEKSLIGVVVWRRPHVNMSPRASSHHKHSGSRKHSRKHLINSSSARSSFTPTHPVSPTPTNNIHPSNDDEYDDDVPPGFGPSNSRDEDDLPEFDFTNTAKPSVPSIHSRGPVVRHPPPSGRPMEQMRELVYKYGHSKKDKALNIETEPWNDDDDIPEWDPRQDNQLQSQAAPPHAPPQPQPQQSLNPTPPPPSLPPPLPLQQPASQLHLYQQPPLQPFQVSHNAAVPPNQQLPPQQLAQTAMPHQQPLQPQMGVVQPSWNPNQWPTDVGMPVNNNGSMQPLPLSGHSYGFHNMGGSIPSSIGWRPDLTPRNNRGG
ncbi:PHD finger protein 3 [Ananas comosus]|uniref:PHD finger protein 3 n=1 Tax=Ananas comosus TaxID=4615 RepID=A0A199VR72_ANACO|nr:PHD finger protein 3 [Ananas comosus]